MLNSGLAVLLLVAAGFAYESVGTSSSSAATRVRTGTVAKGTVVATVSASGSLISPSDLGLGFVTGGTLRHLSVKVGDRVKTGQLLANVDDTTQREALTTAKNTLAGARASLAVLVQGQTPQQRAATAVQLEQSAAQITQAQNSVAFAEKSNANDAASSAASVSSAQAAVTDAKTALAAAKATLASDKAGNTKAVAADQTKVDQASQALSQASDSLTQAQQQQSSTALKDEQSLTQAQQQVASAQLSYKGQLAQQAVTNAPPTASQLAQANAQVASAQIQVAAAQRALDGTTLKAPATGTVMSIGTLVGGTVSSGSGSSGTGTTSTATSTTNAPTGVVPAADIAGHTATVTSGDTGFLVLTNITGLQVQASFSEDDTALLSLGQGATVTLNALPDSPINASVASIASTGTSTSGVVSYTVDLTLKNPPKTIKTGQSGSVSVILKESDDTLYVPTTAVTTAGGVSTVTVVNGSTRTRTVVTVGVVGDTTTEIKSGVTAGQSVALSTATATSGTGFPAGGFPAGRGAVTGTLTGGGTIGGARG